MADAIVLDTNLLVLLVVGSVDETLIPKCKRTASFTQDDFTLLVKLLLAHDRHLACASVLAETCNLLESENARLDQRLFRCLRTMVQDWDHPTLDNKGIMSQPFFLKFGFTDASLSQLATEEETLILTADAPLYACLIGRKPLPLVENFTHIRFSLDEPSQQQREKDKSLVMFWREQLRLMESKMEGNAQVKLSRTPWQIEDISVSKRK